MRFIIQIILFFIAFSAVFYGVRLIPGMDISSLNPSMDGVGWLYSQIGLIFGVFAAFTIQSQAKKWDELLSAIRQEVNNLRRLFWLSYHLTPVQAKKLRGNIRNYLSLVIHEGWKDIDTGHRSTNMEFAIQSLQEVVFDISHDIAAYSPTATAIIRSIFESREERMFQSAKRTPLLLKATIYVGAFFMIGLSFFIAVSNFWINFIFVGSISFLVVLIIMVIEDLEHPYRPGHWHVTQEAYQILLNEVSKNNK